MIQRIKKNDQVQVISGRDKGAEGVVLNLDLEKNKVLVKGINVITRHMKPKARGEKGKIVKEEAYIAISNVMPVCPETKKPTRVRSRMTEDGKRVRVSVRSGQPF
ncbi:MAG: 50S ribosomal protein L24 [Candidatus Dependentiae bacterium]|jgi:large subunit ribosomal protein L24